MIKLEKRQFEGKLLICDMDGTLLNSKSQVSDENALAIKRFVEGGGLFTVATGRMYKTVAPYLKDLSVNAPAIVYNGAAIYDFSTGKVLWENCLPQSIEAVARRILKRYPDIGFQILHGSEIYFIRQNIETEKHMAREGFKPQIASLEEVPRPWYKVLLAAEPEILAEVEAFLKEMEEPFHAVYSEPQFLELLNISASKGHALKELTALLQHQGNCVVAMGDNLNDVEMIKAATVGIAVGNAHCNLKECADFCCCHHDKHAVAEVIQWIQDGIITC